MDAVHSDFFLFLFFNLVLELQTKMIGLYVRSFLELYIQLYTNRNHTIYLRSILESNSKF